MSSSLLEFLLGVDGDNVLRKVIVWVGANLQPEDIFTREQLDAAAIEYVSEHMDPGDVFHRDKLEAWAKAAGYKLQSEE